MEIHSNPFKGPESYSVQDQASFHGRENDVLKLYNLISGNTLTLLYSQSGYGKSSVIQAGLINTLSQSYNFLPIVYTLPAPDCQFSTYLENDIIGALDKAIDQLVAKSGITKRVEDVNATGDDNGYTNTYTFSKNIEPCFDKRQKSLFEFLYSTSLTCNISRSVIKDGITRDEMTSFPIIPVIIFDQFEELFTTRFSDIEFYNQITNELKYVIEDEIPSVTIADYKSKKNANDGTTNHSLDYYLEMQNALTSSRKNFRFLFSFREEYLTKFESLKNKIPSILNGHNRFCLEPFNKVDAAKVIKKISPEISNVPEFAELIVDKLANIPDNKGNVEVEPFVLSLFCFFIYEDIILKYEVRRGNSTEENVLIWKQLFIDEYQLLLTKVGGKDDIIEDISNKYFLSVFNHFSNEVKDAIADHLISKDYDTGIYGRKLALKKELLADRRLGSNIIEKLLGQKQIFENKKLRYLKPESFVNDEYIRVIHDKLVDPLIVVKKEREEAVKRDATNKILDQEKAKRVKRRYKLILSLFIVFVVFFSGAFYLQALLNIQYNAIGGAEITRGYNPTLAYTLVKDAKSIFPFNQNINNVLFSFDTSDDAFIVSRISLPDEICAVSLSATGDSITTYGFSGIYDWDSGGNLISWKPSPMGTLRNYGKVNGKLCYLLDRNGSDTCEMLNINGEVIRKFKEYKETDHMSFSPDGKNVLVGNLLYHLGDTTNKPDTLIPPNADKGWLCSGFCPDNMHCYAGFWDGSLLMYNSKNGKVIKWFKGIENSVVSAVTFTNDMKFLITGDHENNVKIWEIGTLADSLCSQKDEKRLQCVQDNATYLPKVYLHGHNGYVTSLATIGDSVILSGSDDKNVVLWNFKGDKLVNFKGSDCEIKSVGFSPDKKTVYAVNADNKLFLWKTGAASKIFADRPAFRFSPLDYTYVGLSPNKEPDNIDTSSLTSQVNGILHLQSSLPAINRQLLNNHYSAELKKEISHLKQLYQRLFRDQKLGKNGNVSLSTNLLLRRLYGKLIEDEPELISEKYGYNDSIPHTNLVNHLYKKLYYQISRKDSLTAEILFKDTLDIYDVLRYCDEMETMAAFYSDTGYSTIAINYIKKSLQLKEKFAHKYPNHAKIRSTIGDSYLKLFLLYIETDSIAAATRCSANYIKYKHNSLREQDADFLENYFRIFFALFEEGEGTAKAEFLKVKDQKLRKSVLSICYKDYIIDMLTTKANSRKHFPAYQKKRVENFISFLKRQPCATWQQKSIYDR